MLAKKNLEGVLIIPETFKRDIAPVWEILEQALNDEVDVVAKYSPYNLGRLFMSIQNYNLFFQVISNSDTTIIVFSHTKHTKEVFGKVRTIWDDTLRFL